MANEDIERLTELAEKATPGPWNHVAHYTSPGELKADVIVSGTSLTGVVDVVDDVNACDDAAFIASANPATILSLLDRLKAAEAENARLREALRPFADHYQSWMDRFADNITSTTFPIHTFGDLRRARAAIGGGND